MFEEALLIIDEREIKGKGKRKIYTHLNVKFQRIARRDKNNAKKQRKTIEWGRVEISTRKVGDIKGTIHARMGTINDRNGKYIKEAEKVNRRWQVYTEEPYKKHLNDPKNFYSMITLLDLDILECEMNILEWEVKRALGSITANKVSEVREFQLSYLKS